MVLPSLPSGTGAAQLPDVGTLSYNGIVFSSLYKSRVEGKVVPDEAKRTTKLMDYTIYVEGIVTLPSGQESADLDDVWTVIKQKLTQTAGELEYSGKGFGEMIVDSVQEIYDDLAWGPFPTLLEFSPLGNSNAAFIRWQVETRLTEQAPAVTSLGTAFAPVMQFSWDYHVRYDQDGYANVRITGVLEIPLTRSTQESRLVTFTVDNFRTAWLNMDVDLTTYKVTERNFEISKDKRLAQWSFACEEQAPMGLPPGCTSARGTMSVRNTTAVIGGKETLKLSFNMWQVSLRCTYTVRGDQDRRVAMLAFYSLLWFRVNQSRYSSEPPLNTPGAAFQAAAQGALQALAGPGGAPNVAPGVDNAVDIWNAILNSATPPQNSSFGVILTDFGFDEGLYEDSKTISFHASWWLPTNWQSILAASGFLRWQPGTAGKSNANLYSQSVEAIMGATSWKAASLLATSDVIVDVGGGGPWGGDRP
jgi:hypothetical protein